MTDQAIISLGGKHWACAVATPEENGHLHACDGYCDDTTRTIGIRNLAALADDQAALGDLAERMRHNKRHELVHAKLYSDGLGGYAQDETLAEWIASQFGDLWEAFAAWDCLPQGMAAPSPDIPLSHFQPEPDAVVSQDVITKAALEAIGQAMPEKDRRKVLHNANEIYEADTAQGWLAAQLTALEAYWAGIVGIEAALRNVQYLAELVRSPSWRMTRAVEL